MFIKPICQYASNDVALITIKLFSGSDWLHKQTENIKKRKRKKEKENNIKKTYDNKILCKVTGLGNVDAS